MCTHTNDRFQNSKRSDIEKVLTVSGMFTDETDAVSAVEIIPVGTMDKASAVFAVFVAMGPVIRLARLPLPDSNNINNMYQRSSITQGVC